MKSGMLLMLKIDLAHVLRSELVRYRQFLGIQKEQQNIAEEQEKLKKSFAAGKDIVSPDNLNTINQARAEGTPADRCASLPLPSPNLTFASTISNNRQHSLRSKHAVVNTPLPGWLIFVLNLGPFLLHSLERYRNPKAPQHGSCMGNFSVQVQPSIKLSCAGFWEILALVRWRSRQSANWVAPPTSLGEMWRPKQLQRARA